MSDVVCLSLQYTNRLNYGVSHDLDDLALDSPDGLQRSIEYNCYDRFTEFLTKDFIEMLRGEKHGLHITSDPSRTTIIGASYGGLAAFYAGLTQPSIFGHVIAQSPAFLAQRLSVLDKMVMDFSAQNRHSAFILEMGTYENNIAEFEFEDGSVQALRDRRKLSIIQFST